MHSSIRLAPNYQLLWKVAALFRGTWPETHADKENFWNGVAYYSFVQELLSGPRVRPTSDMWAGGILPFNQVINQLEPEFVLALGNQLWEKLPPVADEDNNIPVSLSTETRQTACRYSYRGGSAFSFGIPHPSSFGWSYRTWSPWVRAALAHIE